ncbi:PIG-L deacetylase family protein [Pseudomonas sp. TE3610]
MSERKQQLLKAYRRKKRIVLIVALVVLIVFAVFAPWWSAPLLVVLAWVAHEAWFADHLFYRASDDYQYIFPETAQCRQVTLGNDGALVLSGSLPAGETLLLEVNVTAGLSGRVVDPYVQVGDDRQDFERAVAGRRYLNLSGQREALAGGALRLRGRHCRLAPDARLVALDNPDFSRRRVMVLAPHADDAELAAFGLYHRTDEVSIVTLTQGEIEAQGFRALGLDGQQAARLKGRLRTWDSLAVPLWGGVGQDACVQLGYYCLQLQAMAAARQTPFGSRESGESDTRSVRGFNPLTLAGDADGQPTWDNLVADLRGLIKHFRPQVVVMPHPELDPHPDHVATGLAFREALQGTEGCEIALLYANHLPDNDRWPMGPAGAGIALPPAVQPLPADGLWSPTLSAEQQVDKAMALGMQHDLQGPLPLKRRLRRWIQHVLAGRRWPASGDNEFFRKAVRRHELFWVRNLKD